MEYGYFDDRAKEYVITNPKTPSEWKNYPGTDRYSMEVTNNAGGRGFIRTEDQNEVLKDRYVYIRDDDDLDFWSASWQPVGKDFKDYRSICRHGLGYTKLYASYSGIHSEVLYYVPVDADYEVWAVNVENHSKRPRNLTVTGFCSFPSKNASDDSPYAVFTTRTLYENNRLRHQIFSNLTEDAERSDGKKLIERFLGLSGIEVSSYCGDKDTFFGTYGDLSAPQGIVSGDAGDELSYASEAVGALSYKVTLEPGESSVVCFTAGLKNDADSTEIVRHYEVHTRETVSKELKELKAFWAKRLSAFEVQTPSAEFNRMVNVWNPYTCIAGWEISDMSQLLPNITELRDDGWYSEALDEMLDGYADDRGKKALDLIKENRNTAFGAVSLDPPCEADNDSEEALYNPGIRGNGGIFSQSQGRLILAEALLGNGDDAFMFYEESAPAAQNRKADTRRTEPYAYSEFTEGKYSPNFGRSHGSWNAKAAGVIETACIEGICGIRPDDKGLYISPSIHSEWTEFTIHMSFMGHSLCIQVKNPGHRQSGIEKMTLNGKVVEGCYIPEEKMTENNDIIVYL